MNALVGFRAWNLTNEGDLVSLHQDTAIPWPAKSKMQAACVVLAQRKAQLWGEGQTLGGYGYLTSSAYLTSSSYVPPLASVVGPRSFSDWWTSRVARKKSEREIADHYPPERECSCGIYAAKTDGVNFQSYASDSTVYGEVYLWGKVQEYTDGYRAEFAYPKSLTTRCAHLAERVSERYGVPCEIEAQGEIPVFESKQTRLQSFFASIRGAA